MESKSQNPVQPNAQHSVGESAPGMDTATSSLNPKLWTLPASILVGSIIAGAFSPWLLIISIGATIWLAAILRSNAAQIQSYKDSQRQFARSIQNTTSLTALLGSILDSADVPIVATDQHGSIIRVNRASQAVLGSGRSLLGDHFESLITQKAVQEIEELARRGESAHARLTLPVGGDMRVFDVVAEPIASTRGAVCTFTDITELTRSATLKADFAANASHELRTPIASILGAIQTLEGPARNDERMSQRLITMISSNATRLDLLVKDLLDLSKLESTLIPTVLTEIDLEEMFERTAAPFASVCERRELRIETKIMMDDPIIISDDSLLELILRNLIGNAAKFSHKGTVISIHAEPIIMAIDPDDPPPEGLTSTTGIRLSVRDRGIGIPLSHQTRIFERFYQVDEARDGSAARRGTGLGLAIVKHAARTLGGTIRVSSVHQKGTTMIVELPCCVPESSVFD
mgnify:FL=1|tara:strand:- start:572 stop:1954 length:1383 start_codon:yes stop_codon:yes gene_type:complete